MGRLRFAPFLIKARERVSLETLQSRRFGRSVLRVNLALCCGARSRRRLLGEPRGFLELSSTRFTNRAERRERTLQKINKKQAPRRSQWRIFSLAQLQEERLSRLTRHAGHLLLFSPTFARRARFVLVRAANFSIPRAINNRLVRAP